MQTQQNSLHCKLRRRIDGEGIFGRGEGNIFPWPPMVLLRSLPLLSLCKSYKTKGTCWIHLEGIAFGTNGLHGVPIPPAFNIPQVLPLFCCILLSSSSAHLADILLFRSHQWSSAAYGVLPIICDSNPEAFNSMHFQKAFLIVQWCLT